MNCCVVPRGIAGFAGVTVITCSTAGVMVKVAVPEMFPELAVMVVVPTPVLVASPMVGTESLIVATFSADEVQYAAEVRSWLEPSL